jgi:sugar-specific transcriptional regulator TrmB
MLTLHDAENILCDFSLTKTQAKIFLAILQLNFATVREIAQHSKVRREQVYRITPQLEELGLVIRGVESPTRFRAIPMSDALSLLLDEIRENADNNLATLAAKKEQVENNFNLKMIPLQDDVPNPKFTLISERHQILNQINLMIQQAKAKISIIFSRHKILQFLSLYEEILSEAQQKGVTIRIITERSAILDDTSSMTKQLTTFSWLNIRYANPPLVHFIIVDDNELMLATSTNVYIGDHPKLWTTDEELLIEFQQYYASIWKQSLDANEMHLVDTNENLPNL